jgi:predicted dehydrogenase
MYAQDLLENYQDVARLTGLCDINEGRIENARQILGQDIPGFTNFDEMLDQVPCDVVIVTTKDATHDEFIIRAMERGKDVITEKPMTTTADKCNAILAAERRTGRNVRVTFNYRYAPYKTQVKKLLVEGIVGEIQSVEFRWFLDTVHGADYFRRWHAHKDSSGGLIVHKSTHHFDLINWWLGLEPKEVAAMGSRQYYVPSRFPEHGERCATCAVTDRCPFYLNLHADEKLRTIYLENEQFDGYYRDQCVFSKDIDIEDTLSVLVRYPKQIQLTYGLTAATSFEGWQVAFNGSHGRLEAFEPEYFVRERHQTDFARRASSSVRQPLDWRIGREEQVAKFDSLQIRFYPLFGGVQTFDVPYVHEGHGGGDRLLRDHLFRDASHDPFGHVAGSGAGAMSILVGIAANKSMAENKFVRIEDLLTQ